MAEYSQENTSRLYNVGRGSRMVNVGSARSYDVSSAYGSLGLHNIVRDYDKAQGTTHPADLSYQIIRDINLRYVTVENSSTRPVGVAIMPYLTGPVPPIKFILEGGEIKHLGINSQGGPDQTIWLLDVNSKQPLGNPTMLHRHVNQFVVRQGLNNYFIQFFVRPSYRAAF